MMILETGQTFTETRVFTQAEFDAFAVLSGDDNPIHVDPAFAAGTRFGRPVAHGMMLYGFLCGLLGRHLPGATQATQALMFPAPTFAGEPVRLEAAVLATDPAAREATLRVTITRADGEICCEGETTLFWSEM